MAPLIDVLGLLTALLERPIYTENQVKNKAQKPHREPPSLSLPQGAVVIDS